jgi:hypothetical protein
MPMPNHVRPELAWQSDKAAATSSSLLTTRMPHPNNKIAPELMTFEPDTVIPKLIQHLFVDLPEL